MMRTKRGSTLVFSYLVVAALLALGSATLVHTFAEQSAAQLIVRQSTAFEAAEAGVDDAIAQLKANPNWSGTSYTTLGSQAGYEVTVTILSSTLKQLTSSGYHPSNVPSAYGYQRRQVEAVALVTPHRYNFGLFAAETIQLNSIALVDSYDSTL